MTCRPPRETPDSTYHWVRRGDLLEVWRWYARAEFWRRDGSSDAYFPNSSGVRGWEYVGPVAPPATSPPAPEPAALADLERRSAYAREWQLGREARSRGEPDRDDWPLARRRGWAVEDQALRDLS